MRKRFEQQLVLGQLPIEQAPIQTKNPGKLDELLAALKAIYCNKEYNEKIFRILEDSIKSKKKNTGRNGMTLWSLFVLSQVRLAMNLGYHELYDLANNHRSIRYIMGVEFEFGYPRIEFGYQNIYDNVTLLTDQAVVQINEVIVQFGHGEVFKKKEETPLRLKTDSFVVESNVHFPTDYNLLWDSARKCIDFIEKYILKYSKLKGWRKLNDWRYELKGMMRELGKASASGGKGKKERVSNAALKYLNKAKALNKKLDLQLPELPINDNEDLYFIISIEHFKEVLQKHIDLVERRIIKGESIAHEEKMFSIFETYTEWIKKGKSRPNVELGRKVSITTDQNHLILDYQIMSNQQDRDIVIETADRLINKYKIESWSFDKGYWNKDNKSILQLEIPQVIMPKLGKLTKLEKTEETTRTFKKLKNSHNAVESNINELECRGLDRCPDKGFHNFSRYIGLGICSYNLKKIGRKILQNEKLEQIALNSSVQQRA